MQKLAQIVNTAGEEQLSKNHVQHSMSGEFLCQYDGQLGQESRV